MAIVSQSKSFQRSLLFSIGGIFLLFSLCFSLYQHKREKDYKIDVLHSRLQMYNYELENALEGQYPFSDTLLASFLSHLDTNALRFTIVDLEGRVIFDSHESLVDSLDNHLLRAEIQQALLNGSGYDIKRVSSSTQETYFYSATRFKHFIVRSAVPYSSELTRSLQADNTYLVFAIALTLLLGAVLYWSTHRISRHIGYLREFALKAEQGQPLDVELEKQLPDDELGDISHTIIMLYWKLRHSEGEKVRIKRQLTHNAAHELKTPAASIHGYLESILDNPDMPPDKRQHFLERCYAQSERMNRLLLDMSVLTKLDEMEDNPSGSSLQFQQLDVSQIVRNVLDDTALELQQRNMSVSCNIPSLILVLGDPSLLYSVFRNIIDNILNHASDADQVNIQCISGMVDNSPSFLFSISDNGKGVDPRHLPHLFERFYRVDEGRSRKLGGTGLGLSIVKNAVVAHGGTIAAENAPGGGLTIRFSLPMAPSA